MATAEAEIQGILDEEDGFLADIEEEAQETVKRLVDEGIRHFEEELEQDLIDATDYYHGRPFGNEKKGRSTAVSTDVRDVTLGQMPSLMRIFMGSEKTVEFRPRREDQVPAAEQMTRAVNHTIQEDNEGFLEFYSWFKDALVRRLGVVKWWWEEDQRIEATQYTGLSERQLAMLQQDPSVQVEITDVRQSGPPPPPQVGPQGVPVQGRPPLAIDATIYRTEDEGRARFTAIPSEEFIFTPESRRVDSAPMVGHIREVPKDELIMMGIDEDLIDKKQGQLHRTISNEGLESARQINRSTALDRDTSNLDKSQLPVPFGEIYAKIDLDGDGVAEVRRFECIGNDWEIVNGEGLGEIVDEVPFAVITPDPEPHTIIGLSNYDLVGDVQKIKSHAWRAMLDSLTLSVNPQQEVVEGEVNTKDLLNPEIGAFIRVRKPGMIREVKHSFVGPDVLPVLAAQDDMRENRTGFTKNASGLDSEHLQSTTQVAAAAHVTASQQRIELIARVFAETGVKKLYKGLMGLMVKHQNRPRMMRLSGNWVEVDPRVWDSTMDVSVNVALGQGTPQERLQTLSGIIATQRELMQSGSPLVTNVELRHSLGKAAELGGFPNDESFFRPWTVQHEQQAQQAAAQQPPPPDPNMLLLQIESEKAKHEARMEELKLQLEQQKEVWKDDRERDKLARETALKEAELELKHSAEITDSQLRAQVERDRAAMDADVKREVGLEREATRRRATRPRTQE